MTFQGLPPGVLRQLLEKVLSRSVTNATVSELVRISHAIAHPFLISKQNTSLLSLRHGLDTRDIAYDCIAELFQQDDHGSLVQIEAYFSSMSPGAMSDEEILAALRRLVFAKVNNGLFRLFNEADPVLGKILRNIKLALASIGQFQETERLGQTWLVPVQCDPMEHLPSPDIAALETALFPQCKGTENVPELLGKVAHFLRDQTQFARRVPLMTVASLFKRVYTRDFEIATVSEPGEGTLDQADLRTTIDRIIAHSRERNKSAYVIRKRVAPEVYDAYHDVIRDALVGKYIEPGNDGVSLYEGLRRRLGGLTRATYGKQHRSRLEYLFRNARKEALQELRELHKQE